MTKRARPESLQGELQPHPAKAKIDNHTMSSQIDDQTVFSQLDMPVPEDALVEDDTIADNATLDERVRNELKTDDRRRYLGIARHYHSDLESCTDTVHAFASVLLPAIFEDNQHSLVASYKDTIKHNPWLIKMLVDAYNEGTYGNIRRIGLCGS